MALISCNTAKYEDITIHNVNKKEWNILMKALEKEETLKTKLMDLDNGVQVLQIQLGNVTLGFYTQRMKG